MKAAGVNTNVLKLHSVRSTSTTAAKLGEVPIDEMTTVVGWQSDSMFSKFYCKPVVNNSSGFADEILKQIFVYLRLHLPLLHCYLLCLTLCFY